MPELVEPGGPLRKGPFSGLSLSAYVLPARPALKLDVGAACDDPQGNIRYEGNGPSRHPEDGDAGPRRVLAEIRFRGLGDWRLHDLRRTVAANPERMGVERITIGSPLAHHIPGVTAIYTRSDRIERMRYATQCAASEILGILSRDSNADTLIRKPSEKVVRL
jgi:hypothetical protein